MGCELIALFLYSLVHRVGIKIISTISSSRNICSLPTMDQILSLAQVVSACHILVSFLGASQGDTIHWTQNRGLLTAMETWIQPSGGDILA